MENNITIGKKRHWKPLLGGILILLLLGGWLYPPLGYFMIVCMVMAMGIGAIKGRHWCDWMCPRGSFLDTFLGRFSRNVKAPRFFHSLSFRLMWLGILMGMLAVNLLPLWPDFYLMGKPFVMILTVTTAVGLVLGMLYQPRAWCACSAPWVQWPTGWDRARCPLPSMKTVSNADCARKYAECKLTPVHTKKTALSPTVIA